MTIFLCEEFLLSSTSALLLRHYLDIDIIDKEYDEKVTFTYLCKEPIDTRIQELTNGQYTPEYIETLEVEVTIKEA